MVFSHSKGSPGVFSRGSFGNKRSSLLLWGVAVTLKAALKGLITRPARGFEVTEATNLSFMPFSERLTGHMRYGRAGLLSLAEV